MTVETELRRRIHLFRKPASQDEGEAVEGVALSTGTCDRPRKPAWTLSRLPAVPGIPSHPLHGREARLSIEELFAKASVVIGLSQRQRGWPASELPLLSCCVQMLSWVLLFSY